MPPAGVAALPVIVAAEDGVQYEVVAVEIVLLAIGQPQFTFTLTQLLQPAAFLTHTVCVPFATLLNTLLAW